MSPLRTDLNGCRGPREIAGQTGFVTALFFPITASIIETITICLRFSHSSAVVGFNSGDYVKDNNYIVGVQFENVGENALADFDSLMKPNQVGEWSEDDDTLGGAPMLMVLINGGYSYFYYISNATDFDDEEVGYNCWADPDGYILTDADKQKIGNGFWVRFSKSEPTPALTFNGQVDAAASVTVDLVANQNKIVINPFPTTLNLANLTFTDGITPGEWSEDDDTLGGAPMIMKLIGGGYSYYYYISNATDSDDEEVGYDCWADPDGYILDDSVNPTIGSGFWLRTSKDGKAVFTSPLSK